MKEITKEWLEYAKADLKSCDNNIKDESLTNIVAFHCQQAIEKCFKAIIEEYGLRLERIHNLFKLYKAIETKISFSIDIDKLELIDKVYTTSRYPGDMGLMPEGKPTVEGAKQMYDFAKYIFDNTIQLMEKSK